MVVTFVEETDAPFPTSDSRSKLLNANGEFGFTQGELQSLPFSVGQSVTAKVKVTHWLGYEVNGLFPKVANSPQPHPLSLINGDVVSDETVDIADYVALAAAFGALPGESNWNDYADLNHDGIVDIADYCLLINNFGRFQSRFTDPQNWEITYEANGSNHGLSIHRNEQTGALYAVPINVNWSARQPGGSPTLPLLQDYQLTLSTNPFHETWEDLWATSTGTQRVRVQWIGAGNPPEAVNVAIRSWAGSGNHHLNEFPPDISGLTLDNGLDRMTYSVYDKPAELEQGKWLTVSLSCGDGDAEINLTKSATATISGGQVSAVADAFGLEAEIDRRRVFIVPDGSWPTTKGPDAPQTASFTYLNAPVGGTPIWVPSPTTVLQETQTESVTRNAPLPVPSLVEETANENSSTWHVGIPDIPATQESVSLSEWLPYLVTFRDFETFSFPVMVTKPEFPLRVTATGRNRFGAFTRSDTIESMQELESYRVQIDFDRRLFIKRYSRALPSSPARLVEEIFHTHDPYATQPMTVRIVCKWPDDLTSTSTRQIIPHLVLDSISGQATQADTWQKFPTTYSAEEARFPTAIRTSDHQNVELLPGGWIDKDVEVVEVRFAPVDSWAKLLNFASSTGNYAITGTELYLEAIGAGSVKSALILAAQQIGLENIATLENDAFRTGIIKGVPTAGWYLYDVNNEPAFGKDPMFYKDNCDWRVAALPKSDMSLSLGSMWGRSGYLGHGYGFDRGYAVPLGDCPLITFFRSRQVIP